MISKREDTAAELFPFQAPNVEEHDANAKSPDDLAAEAFNHDVDAIDKARHSRDHAHLHFDPAMMTGPRVTGRCRLVVEIRCTGQ